MSKVPKRKRARTASVRQLTVKRSITIDAAVDVKAHALVGERGFSALVNQALNTEIQRRAGFDLLRDLDAEYGPLTESDIERGEALWRTLDE